MKKISLLISTLSLLICSTLPAQETRYGGDPLLLGAGARSLGMGSAFVAVSDDVTALYWNPGGLVQLQQIETQVQHAEQFGGTVNHDIFTIGGPSPVGSLGFGLFRLGVDGIKLTTLEDPALPLGPDNRPIISQIVGTSEYSLYLAYAKSLRPKLSIGSNLKLIWRNLNTGSGSGYGIDIGLLYIPNEDLRLGLSIRNLTKTQITFDSGAKDTVSPSLLLGLAYSNSSPVLRGSLTVSASAHYREEKSSVEDLQGFQIGAEYFYRKKLAFRLGAEGNHFAAGMGIRMYDRIGFDLAFLEHGQLDNTYRLSASIYF